jgi:hypothetical protein
VHRRLLEVEPASAPAAPRADDGELLAAGVAQVLAAPDPVLRAYAEPLRAGILEIALAAAVPPAVADRAAGVLLASLPRAGKAYARFAVRRASQLLARHADDRARAVLEELKRAQPGSNLAARWLAALDARRIGRIALRGEAAAGRLAPAFWLDGQQAVWVRTAGAASAERVAEEARLQDALALPGLAPVVEHGVASGIPYVAVAGAGRPLVLEAARRLDLAAALALAGAAVRLLRALALAGVVLPDAAPERFLHAPESGGLTLADLDGALAAHPASAEAAQAALAGELTEALLGAARLAHAAHVREALARAPADACELARALDRAALRVERT